MTERASARLIVLRHAKSAWPEGVPDHERPLAPRGRRDARAAARWLRGAGVVPDLVVSSTACRALATWALIAPELGTVPSLASEERVYDAPAAALLDVVRQTPAERRTVVLIGHQPGVQELVVGLAGDAEGDALERASAAFPTSAIAVLTVPGAWAHLAPSSAALTAFVVPRGRI